MAKIIYSQLTQDYIALVPKKYEPEISQPFHFSTKEEAEDFLEEKIKKYWWDNQ